MITPASIEAAVAARASGAVYAGGMTIHMLDRAAARPHSELIDLAQVPGLTGVSKSAGSVSIGAMTTLEAMRGDPALIECFPALVRLLASVGSLSLRHQATLGGNIAWGHGDLIVPLLALGAEIVTPEGRFPVGEQPLGALILAVDLPLSDARLETEKVGYRAAFSPTLVTVAACFAAAGTRLSAGGGPTKPARLMRTEDLLKRTQATASPIPRDIWTRTVREDAAWGTDALAGRLHRADVAARILLDMVSGGVHGRE